MPITAKQSKNKDWDFNVVQEPLYTGRVVSRIVENPNPHHNPLDTTSKPTLKEIVEEPERSGYFASVRSDNGEVLGVHTSRYGIVQNGDLIEKAESAFARKGLGDYERNIYVTDGGAKRRVNYDFKGHDIEVPEGGDKMGFRLTLQNSFDRSLRVSFALGMLRLVCTNGMQTLEKELDMLKKHSKKFDLNALLTDDAIDKALASFTKTGNTYAALARVGITQEQGIFALQNQADTGLISDKVREGISSVWNNPREDGADGSVGDDRNLYQLYNAATQYLTSDNLVDKKSGDAVGTFESTRFEYANRVSGQLLKRFNLASDNPKRFEKLVAVAKADGVKVENN